MVIPDEENFPRGGVSPQKRRIKDAVHLFNITEPKQKKAKKNKREKAQVNKDSVQQELNLQDSLTYKTIQPGMLILGCIRSIENVCMEVELPGLWFASINITDISDPFTKNLNNMLENEDSQSAKILRKMFTVGEFVLVKILRVEVQDKKTPLIEGTINPRLIYSEYNFSSFKKGMLLWSAIGSKADHGYEINIGIKGCRIFLPFKNIDDDSQYLIGKPIWCVVHKSEVSSTASILRVSSKFEHIDTSSMDIDNLDSVIPGSRVELFVDKITSYGIQGTFSDHFIGYINNSYLSEEKKKLSDYKEGHLLISHILYIEPITKIAHLSLSNLKPIVKPDLNIGDVLTGEVTSKAARGMFFLLNNEYWGFVTNRRLINTVTDNSKIKEPLNKKYSIGSKHQCRILDYNHLWKAFICTTECHIVQEPIFSAKDLVDGQHITISIQSIVEEGMVASYKNIRGFITNQHISDSEYTSNLKKKYRVNQKVEARVLKTANNKLLFTIKPSLVKCEANLTKYEDAQIGKSYLGIVVKIDNNGSLIAFYGNVRGWLYNIKDKDDTKSSYFFIGQVVKVYVKKAEHEWLLLSLFKPKEPKGLKIGSKVCGTVTLIDEDGFHFTLENNSKSGYIPNSHISTRLSLCNGFKNTINTGQRLTNLLYIGGTDPCIFSRKETIMLNGKIVTHRKKAQIGDIVRCFYHSTASNGIYVLLLLRGMTEPVILPSNVSNNDEEKSFFMNLKPYQTLLVRVIKKNNKKFQLELDMNQTVKVEGLIDYFTHYLNDFSYIKEYGQKNDWKITEYEPGTEIDCKIEQIGTEEGCILTLPNGVKGIAVPFLCHKKIKVNDTVIGKVLSYDFDKQFVYICLRQNIFSHINTEQTGNMDEQIVTCIAEKLLVENDCIIAVLKHPKSNKQLIYVPLKSNENDFTGYASYYNDNNFKICICGKVKGNLIGISRKLFLKLDKPNRNAIEVVDTKQKDKAVKQKSASSSAKKTEESGEKLIKNDIDLEGESNADHTSTEESSNTKPVILPAMTSFFKSSSKRSLPSDSEDENDEPIENRKKRKLTPAERAEQLRKQEEQISKIERDLTDSSKLPESAAQFDRLLQDKPNSSGLWIKYILFHVASSEPDKARTVAKRALDTINMTCVDEKLNIWIALLSLENSFGTKESFDKVLEDALKFNEPLKIYLRVIEMYANDGKYDEMDEKIKKVKSKYNREPTLWYELGRIYYQIGKFQEARNCKDSALRSIVDKKTQMIIIVRFATMEFKYGEEDQGCAIFETVLTADPKKINVWMTYVDQLIKKGHIDQARQVLERAVLQQLPLKSMKSLFMKYRKFEEDYGTPETLENLKSVVHEYIAKFER